MRNLSSLIAIAIALNSAPVERLKLTKKQLSQKMVNNLDTIVAVLEPANNHAAYRSLLREVGAVEYKQCVPWLGEAAYIRRVSLASLIILASALHLKQIRSVLDHPDHRQVIVHDGRPLINFKRYSEYVHKFKEHLAFKAPDLEKQRNAGHLAYLEQRLADVRVDEASEQELMSRSMKHEQGESKMIRNHTLELAALGFSRSSRRRPTTGNGRPHAT
jgi:son of sevenless